MHQPKDAGLVHLGLALAGGGAAMMFLLVAFIGAGAGLGDAAAQCQTQPTATRQSTKIPADYLAAYQTAGQSSGIPWTVIAAVGKVESNHGQSNDAGVHSGANHAGAMGPMQFLSGTWQTYGVDGDNDGTKNVYNPADAIPGAANYLKASGAPGDIHAALFTYNRSNKYVDTVLEWARRYGQQNPQPESAAQDPACQQAMLGTLPDGASTKTARKVIDYARAQLGKPYKWGAEGPKRFDCSGLTMRAYQAAGIHIPRVAADQWNHEPRVPKGQEQPGDLAFFIGSDGTTSHPGHVGIVIGNGQMIAAPSTGKNVQIQKYRQRQDFIGLTRPQ
jgi:cell wall-associated NlpC family hydrolase